MQLLPTSSRQIHLKRVDPLQKGHIQKAPGEDKCSTLAFFTNTTFILVPIALPTPL